MVSPVIRLLRALSKVKGLMLLSTTFLIILTLIIIPNIDSTKGVILIIMTLAVFSYSTLLGWMYFTFPVFFEKYENWLSNKEGRK